MSLAEEIGERGSFMGQSLIARQQKADIQEQEQAELMETRALEPMAGSWKAPGINGLDVSGWQPSVDWQAQWNMGARFAYIKSTEGDSFTSDTFNRQYNGAYNVGMIRGAYHFALPQVGNARSQARFFVNHGGGWSPDGRTLPPLLDIEHNPYDSLGNMCYNMNASQLVRWVRNFSTQVKRMVGRKPMIYTSHAWWTTCTNNSTAVNKHDLHVAAYPSPGHEYGFDPLMFGGWRDYTMWQYSASGPFAGDSNRWNGTYNELKAFATNGFADVTSRTAFYDEIMWMARNDISTGYSRDSTYRPNRNVSRAETAAFLYRLAGSPAYSGPRRSQFGDISSRATHFYDEISWLAKQEITTGYSADNTFRPNRDVSRAEMAAFLYRLAGKPKYSPPATSPFTDINSSTTHFYKQISWLAANQISFGYSKDGSFQPNGKITRAETAAFLKRYNDLFGIL